MLLCLQRGVGTITYCVDLREGGGKGEPVHALYFFAGFDRGADIGLCFGAFVAHRGGREGKGEGRQSLMSWPMCGGGKGVHISVI